MTQRKKILYIASTKYAGSTLLCYLLATHPAMATLGERRHFHSKMIRAVPEGETRCSCGQPFVACAFWAGIRADVLGGVEASMLATNFTGFRFLGHKRLNRLARRLAVGSIIRGVPWLNPFRGRLARLCAANGVLIEAIRTQAIREEGTQEEVDDAVFLDASKPIEHAVFFSTMPEYEVYVIHLVRDVRGQVYSALKYNPGWDARRAATVWKREVIQSRRILARSGMKHHTLRYEDLCADPKGTLAELFDFAGLDPAQGSLAFRDVEQHVMGNGPMRLGDATEIRDRQSWRTHLTPEQLRDIDAVAGPLRKELSYD